MQECTREYNNKQSALDKEICDLLAETIDSELTEAEIGFGTPPCLVFDGNPTVGYSKLKDCIRLMFWSGAILEKKNSKLAQVSLKMHPFAIFHQAVLI